MNIRLCFGLAAMTSLLLAVEAQGRQASTEPRMITVDGVTVRVWTSGLERRAAGQPVIALEAGGGAVLETWTPVFADLAALGPVIAYDRLGLGQSAADPKTPTLSR